MHLAPILVLVGLLSATAQGAHIAWVTVGDPGNHADDVWPANVVHVAPRARVTHGSVNHEYRIGKYEITNAQYADFLNAVASDDVHELYHPDMNPANVRPDFYPVGGIIQTGSPGHYGYELLPERAEWPVTNISFWNALRFANWFHNGQPRGHQGPLTTEDGAYTITPEGMERNIITRNPQARVFLPSEDEWYKAAYYKGAGTDAGYWEFATASDAPPIAEDPPGTASAAYRQPYRRADRPIHMKFEPENVGAYLHAPSAYGTYDQSGNVMEWNETIHVSLNGAPLRGARGGHFASEVEFISASRVSPDWRAVSISVASPQGEDPYLVNPFIGFRLASVDVLPGDANQNGQLNVEDLNDLTLHVREKSPDTWYDLTDDGRIEELDRAYWVHSLKKTYFGDADLNGQFNTQDFVLVFQAGEYEDSVPGNSTWATGDWNGDGEFTSGDFVVALIDGGYEQGARSGLSVPEPATCWPEVMAATMIGFSTRRGR